MRAKAGLIAGLIMGLAIFHEYRRSALQNRLLFGSQTAIWRMLKR